MKPRKITLLSITLLATIMIGAGAILVLSPSVVGANVAWKPKYYALDHGKQCVEAEVWLKGGHKAQVEIDQETILLEGEISPWKTPYNKTHGPRLVIPFKGMDVRKIIVEKMLHMEPGRYRVPLEITGFLKEEYGGLPFKGSGVVVVTIPENSPP